MSFGNIKNGRKVVASAGTAVALASTNTPAKRVIISALTTNTNNVVIGGSTVVAAAGSEQGVILKATSQPLELFQEDLSKIFVDAVTNGEGVSFAYEF